MTQAAKCQEPGCTGSILDGYCDVCGTPGAAAAPDVPAASAPPSAEQEEPITPAARPQPQQVSSVPNGTPCAQPGCPGHILDGYCDVCGTAAESESEEPAAEGSPIGATRCPRSTPPTL